MEQLAAVNHNLAYLVAQMQQEGVLDEQFTQLLELQDGSNPETQDFVVEIVQLYFEDSVRKIDRMQRLLTLSLPNFYELDQLVHQFKGSSASLGARAIAQLCIRLREACQQSDAEACRVLLQHVCDAQHVLKAKLSVYTQLEQKRKQLLAVACEA